MAETKVTRISAKEASPKKATAVKASKQPRKERKAPSNRFLQTLYAIGGYFVGAWVELRQVRWPTRGATWGMTLAVIIFSAFFIVIILLLDLLFKFLFELILS